MREEADVLYVDPIRDAEMAKLVFTRQKVITFVAELPAKDAAQGLLKCIELLGDKNLVADGLQGIIGQRLIRLLCDECKQAYRPNPALLKKVGIPPETKILYRERKAPSSKEGEPDIEPCDNCGGTGFFGRAGMYECIQMSAGMRKVVLGEPTLASIKTQVRQEKMQTLQREGLRLVAQGKTSLEELQRAFKTP